MLNLLKKSLALEIENFTNFLRLGDSAKFTKSAFVQARKKIRPEVFKKLTRTLLEEFYTDNETAVKLWRGFRLLAVDGSRITLPITDELKKVYGASKNQTDTVLVQARCSILYDVQNKYVLDGILAPLKRGERDLALTHLAHCTTNNLLIYDRGYPSYNFIYRHCKGKLDYLMRVKTGFSQLTITASGVTDWSNLNGTENQKESFAEMYSEQRAETYSILTRLGSRVKNNGNMIFTACRAGADEGSLGKSLQFMFGKRFNIYMNTVPSLMHRYTTGNNGGPILRMLDEPLQNTRGLGGFIKIKPDRSVIHLGKTLQFNSRGAPVQVVPENDPDPSKYKIKQN